MTAAPSTFMPLDSVPLIVIRWVPPERVKFLSHFIPAAAYESSEAEPEEAVEYRDLNEQLDDIIRYLKRQIKEQEAMLKAQKKKSAKKK